MRVAFIGSVEFSLSALERLVACNVNIVGLCTSKDSTLNADYVDLRPFASAHGIPWNLVDDINSEQSLNWLKSRSPDVIFCFGWSKLLKEELLHLAPMGVVGFHPSALPANRGRHPIIWALVLGLKTTASTFFLMDAGADSGDIVSQRDIPIDDQDDAGDLYRKITTTALDQIEELLPLLESNDIERTAQNELGANSWRKRGPSDGEIDWRMSAISIQNLVRGLAKPYNGAHFVYSGEMIKVWKTDLYEDSSNNLEPGKVLGYLGVNPIVKCGEGALCLLVTEPSFTPTKGSYL